MAGLSALLLRRLFRGLKGLAEASIFLDKRQEIQLLQQGGKCCFSGLNKGNALGNNAKQVNMPR